MLHAQGDYQRTRDAFTWNVPERYNIGVDVCDRWADGSGRLALVVARHGERIAPSRRLLGTREVPNPRRRCNAHDGRRSVADDA